MIVTDWRCWWQNLYVGDFFHYVGDFFNVLNRSPTSSTRHQLILSPTSVTNIDVTKVTPLDPCSADWTRKLEISTAKLILWSMRQFPSYWTLWISACNGVIASCNLLIAADCLSVLNIATIMNWISNILSNQWIIIMNNDHRSDIKLLFLKTIISQLPYF